MQAADLVIVGGGAAGLSAALAAARLGLACELFDEHPAPRPELHHLATQATTAGARLSFGHPVWGIFPGPFVAVFNGKRTWLIRPSQLILAPGAIDVDLAFPGSELSGVVGGLELLRNPAPFRGQCLSPHTMQHTARLMLELMPGLSELRILRSWSGTIGPTPDGMPILEASAEVRGFVLATGFGGNGFVTAPAVGKIVAELIRRGRTDVDIEGLRAARFTAA